MAGVSTRSLAVRALLALLLVSGSLMHVRAEENIDDLEKDGAAIDNQESEECPSPPDSRLECNLDFQDCLDDPSECTYLDLSYSSLTGTIPSIIGELTALTKLVLNDNDLTGSLSTELGLLTALQTLRLDGNDFTGSLSTELGLLTALGWLILAGNQNLCGDMEVVAHVSNFISTNTNLGTACPTSEPTAAPTREPTAAPTPNPDPSVDKDNRNGIMRAAVAGDTTSLAVALADAKQNKDRMDNTTLGYNALMLAAQYDHQDVARMLLDAGANTGLLTSTDGDEKNNWSNVMVAAWYGGEEITKTFLTASTEHLDTVADYYQMAPLHAAVSRGHSRTTSVLTSFGANVNALDSDNMTPLHYAAKIGHFKCAKTLLTAGAHKHLEDADGKTACDYAAEGENHDIQALLGSCAVPPD